MMLYYINEIYGICREPKYVLIMQNQLYKLTVQCWYNRCAVHLNNPVD